MCLFRLSVCRSCLQVSQSPIQRQLHRVLEECGESCSKFRVGVGDNQAFLMVRQRRAISVTAAVQLPFFVNPNMLHVQTYMPWWNRASLQVYEASSTLNPYQIHEPVLVAFETEGLGFPKSVQVKP